MGSLRYVLYHCGGADGELHPAVGTTLVQAQLWAQRAFGYPADAEWEFRDAGEVGLDPGLGTIASIAGEELLFHVGGVGARDRVAALMRQVWAWAFVDAAELDRSARQLAHEMWRPLEAHLGPLAEVTP